MKSALVLTIVVLMTFAWLFAQRTNGLVPQEPIWEPPVVDWPEELPQATVPTPMVTSLTVGNMRIKLEETSLADAQKRLGGVVGHKGDAGESLYWLCLHGADEDGKWVLWLESSEVDGGDVGGFQYRRIAANAAIDSRCQNLGTDHGLELPVALRLGMTEPQILGILGQPTARQGHTLIFNHEHKTLIHNETFTVSNIISVAFSDGVASAFQVWNTSVD